MKSKITTLALSLLTFFNVLAQKNEFVKQDSIIYPIHKTNIGKIAFMEQTKAIENFKQTDFLQTFELKEKTDFNIRVFLENSLTNYLHLLSPNSTAEELTKNGNYQFTFIVDNKKVYAENLNVGAGTAETKNQKTIFRVPLISSINEDSWGKFLWNRFFGNGGQEAFSEGEHLLKIEIRPYLKLNEIVTGNIIAEGQLKIIVPEIKIDEKLVKVQQIKQIKDWQISKEKIDIAKIEDLNRKIAKKNYREVTSIVVIKNGEILIEEYFNGANRNTLHDTRSVGKSFASTLMGIAIKEKYIKSEMQTLKEFYNLKSFQNYSHAKDSINLKSLLTMSSTFEGSDMNSESPGNEENMYPTKNWVGFTLNLPIDKTKQINKQWDYFTAGCIILGDIINKSVPNGLEKYSNEKLFKPLGIKNFKWQFTPQNVVNTAGSLQLSSLDYAKYGQLYKNNGNWNGKQILSKEWVTKSLSHQINISEDEFYGYLFWNKTYKIEGKNYEVYYSSGNGGNRIFIFKDQPIVIVITSTAYNTPYGEKQVEKIMQQHLIPAIAK
ncbi:serine hydrolase domain-containing protein [Flavobacterium sandaracinum]|uniref:Class C beta-lactamase-related serine hydrolase n=1 Tax=Flavobacterium sandaracinum TaxID=2541733 RepID=A0A4R5CL16_9FLAO|nr:serine hydrolase domain-containing protein [Flavobacterium sandaracinum]TDD99916.1 class C beta-lactamase-related serine hydrolase [Flavobacterium sandaracinum]